MRHFVAPKATKLFGKISGRFGLSVECGESDCEELDELELSLARFVDDGGTPDTIEFEGRFDGTSDTRTSEAGHLVVEPTEPELDQHKDNLPPASEEVEFTDANTSQKDASLASEVIVEDDLIPELDAVAVEEIDEKIHKISDFDPESEIIGVYCDKNLDADPRHPTQFKLHVAKVNNGAGQVIMLNGVCIAHVASDLRLKLRDVTLIKQ